jgi:DNA-directed RNA polymerase subunit beta'
LEFGTLIEQAGFPPGVVNIVTGHGDPCGKVLTSHPKVARISFTGGPGAAKHVLYNSAENFAEVSLELGGKSPFIVFDDANIESAVNGSIAGIFGATGQSCVAGSRLYLHEDIADEFLERMVALAKNIQIGDPLDDDTQMGPLCTLGQMARVESEVARAQAQGGTVLCGGKRPEGLDGNYYEPTIIDCPRQDMDIVDTEMFGPVLSVLRFKTEAEVIELANDTVHGLAAGVFTQDSARSLRVARAIEAGISFGKDDMVVPDDKWTLVDETRGQVKDFEQQYMDGLITQGEKYNKVVDAWSKCNDKVTDAMMSTISAPRRDEDGAELEPNSVYMMAHSGARGSVTQMKQLGGMRGLMAKPNGDIIETPIISNFKEGLTVLEYFNSTHGARKGLSDTALKTANSGYLTRRLVDVAQDCIVRMYDCGTEKAITAETAVNDGEVVLSLSERLLGRVAAEDLLKPGTDEVLVARGELIDERMSDAVDAAGLQVARIRSPLTCEAEEGVCALCYGRDLSRGTIVNSGEAVGIIAAQSIGEPGTQLTMRTFHIGGVAQGGQQSFLEASQPGKIAFEGENTLKNSSGDVLVVGRNMKLLVVDEQGEQRASHKLGYGSKLFVKVGQTIERGDKLFEWDPYTLPIIAEKSGVAKHVDLVNGIAVREETDDATGMTQKIVVDWRAAPKGNELKPEIILLDEAGDPLRNDAGNPLTYPMSVDAILSCDDGQGIKAGDVVARIPREGAKTKDITGGLPRVAELFEARRPKDHAVIAEIDGYVRFGKDYKNKRRISIESADESIEPVEYMVPKGKHIPVGEGDFVQKGDYIVDGNPAPHDILAIMGIEALANYMIDEVQDVYRLQGVKINDKHIEVIVRQMLQKWEISDSGETTLLKGEHVDKIEFDTANAKAEQRGGRPAQGEPILLGITKASLQTRSFISAASFQETTRVLTEASVQGKRDKLIGLKENVIVGRLIPAGTGGAAMQVRQVAQDRDNVVIEARREEAEAAVALAAPSGDSDVFGADVFDSNLVDTPEG